MKAKHLLLFLIILLFVVPTATGQSGITDKIGADEYERGPSLEAIERNAASAYKDGDYYAAMIYYRRILESDSLHPQALKGYGAAAMEMGAYARAEWAYQLLVSKGMTGPDGMPIVNLGEAKFHLCKYEEAKALFDEIIVETPVGITKEVLDKANLGRQSCKLALEMRSKSDTLTQIDTLKELNTAHAEFAPYQKGDTLFYSSYSFLYENDKRYPKRFLAKTLYGLPQSDTLKSQLATFNEENQHTANVTFNDKGDVMYYTICNFIEKTAKIRCDIYRRKLTGDNTWGPAEKLPAPVNFPADSVTNTEPSVGLLPGQDVEVLYFVSDRPGSIGKRDIWYARIEQDGSFSQPVNLDTLINTKENDVTPFYHYSTNTLYFSTNGRASLGGYDVYRSRGNNNGWEEEPENMGWPINSCGNDIYFAPLKEGKTAVFSSNREGATAFKADEEDELEYEQACCYDLFRAPVEKPEIIAVACEEPAGTPLEGVTMRLFQINSQGKAVEEMKTKATTDRVSFQVQPRRSYMIVMSKPKYTTDTLKFTTPATLWTDTIFKKLCLKPAKPHLIVTVFDKRDSVPLPGATVNFRTLSRKLPNGLVEKGEGGKVLAFLSTINELANRFDYSVEFEHRYNASASKRGYFQDSTDEISTEGLLDADTLRRQLYLTRGVLFTANTVNCVTRDTLYGVTYTLSETESGNLVDQYTSPSRSTFYERTVHYDKLYTVIASKDGFKSDTVRFSTKDLSHKSFEHIRRELCLRPLTVQAYLPISLYFDNDEPDKRTTSTTTTKVYQPTYVSYYRRKPEFLDGYSKGLEGTEKQAALDSIEYFFEKDVRAGWEKLFFFSEDLLKMMERGDYIVLTLRGFASPRANPQYNLNLTKRRVASVHNHFLKHDGGIYRPYVENGQLKIVLEPNGEKFAPKDVSDDPKDDRHSLYDPRASRERRLEIIGVEVKRGTIGQNTVTPNLISEPTANGSQ